MAELDQFRRVISYDPESGKFYWLVDVKRRKAGEEAGYISKGYRKIGILYRQVCARTNALMKKQVTK